MDTGTEENINPTKQMEAISEKIENLIDTIETFEEQLLKVLSEVKSSVARMKTAFEKKKHSFSNKSSEFGRTVEDNKSSEFGPNVEDNKSSEFGPNVEENKSSEFGPNVEDNKSSEFGPNVEDNKSSEFGPNVEENKSLKEEGQFLHMPSPFSSLRSKKPEDALKGEVFRMGFPPFSWKHKEPGDAFKPIGVRRGHSMMAATDSASFDVKFDKSDSASTNSSVSENQDDKYRNLTGPRFLVYDAIVNDSIPQGISIHDLCNNIKSLSIPVIKETVDFLTDAGYIYSTIDEEHFKSTE